MAPANDTVRSLIGSSERGGRLPVVFGASDGASRRRPEVLEDEDQPGPMARVADLDAGRRVRLEPRQGPLARDPVVAVARVVHLPVDRDGDDRGAGDPGDLAEGRVLG